MNEQTALSTIQYQPDSWEVIQSKCQWLVKSGMLPTGIDKPEKAAAIVLKGSELGIPAMEAFAQIHIIKGKPTCSAELQLGLLARGGVTYKFTEDTEERATIVFYRPGFEPYESTFSMEDAKRAGLLSNGVWRQYPKAMLRARAISAGARVIGPDLIGGMSYTPEEMGATVNMETGEIIDTPAEVVDSQNGLLNDPVNADSKSVFQSDPTEQNGQMIHSDSDQVRDLFRRVVALAQAKAIEADDYSEIELACDNGMTQADYHKHIIQVEKCEEVLATEQARHDLSFRAEVMNEKGDLTDEQAQAIKDETAKPMRVERVRALNEGLDAKVAENDLDTSGELGDENRG